MATNTIQIDFDPCEPAPANGYLVKYRPLGSDEEWRTVEPNPTDTPVIIVDENDPKGTSYEGTIQGDCGGGKYGVEVPWEAINDESGSASASGSGSDGDGSISIPPEEFDYYLADAYACEDCGGPPAFENILVRVPAGHSVQIGKFYRPVGHPTGFVYTLFLPAQPPASSVELTEDNFTTCGGACSG